MPTGVARFRAQLARGTVDTRAMTDHKPLLVVPGSPDLARAFDGDLASLCVSGRARRNGIVVIAPRDTQPNALMAACQVWPALLRAARVRRVAVVLGVQAYAIAEPLLRACARCLKAHGVAVAYFHEGHLESDCIAAWFEQRKARRRITSDSMVKLSERYAERGDAKAAFHAIVLAEQIAG
jgi:hypothetical protein